MAALLAIRQPPPMPCKIRMTIIAKIAVSPSCGMNTGVRKSRIELSVKIKKPRLYMHPRPNMSDKRPMVTNNVAVVTV